MQYSPQVSIIVMNHNRVQLLKKCIDSILQHTNDVDYELIIVDACSTDSSRQFLLQHYSNNATLIFEDKLHCYATSNNRAIGLSRGKHLALMNNDCMATPGWISNGIKAMQEDDKIGHLAHLVLRGDRYSIMSHGANLVANGDTRVPLCQSNLSNPAWKQAGNYAYAGFGIYRRDLFDKIGGICEEYDNPPSYFQDTHYGLMVNMLGYDVRYCPESVIIHYMDHTDREHFNGALVQGKGPFVKYWSKFLAENGGYAPSYPKLPNESKPYMS